VKKSLDHLPLRKQAEVRHIVEVVRTSFEEAISTRRAARLKHGKVLKVILYGSYARGDWVHDPVGRYFSDFDLLVIVDHEDLTDGEFWHDAENRTMPGEGDIRTPVSIIVHSLDDVNEQLDRGRYFFADILRDGVLLYDTPGAQLHKPADIKAQAALTEAEGLFQDWMSGSASFSNVAASSLRKPSSGRPSVRPSLSRIRITMLSPCAVGSEDTRRSSCLPPTPIWMRPSCGMRFSAMLMFAMIFNREMIESCSRFGGFSTSISTPSIR